MLLPFLDLHWQVWLFRMFAWENKRRKRILNPSFYFSYYQTFSFRSLKSAQKVYLKDDRSVIKLNDAIYYLSWVDYFTNLLLNNYFFPDTAYRLLGFVENVSVLYAVVEQHFINATEKTDLKHVEQFMKSNGFQKTRNNDCFNPELKIILEDLHDENVLTNNGILYFIDTVFYLT